MRAGVIKYRPLEILGIGEMASRRALDAKFEVQILDPQLKTPSYEGVFVVYPSVINFT